MKLAHAAALAAHPSEWWRVAEILRLRRLPPRTPTTSRLVGPPLEVADAPSFLAQYHAIFRREILRFESSNETPRILDLGANIGMSALYFSTLFPRARIEAYEPDPEIFELLVRNCRSAGVEAETHRAAVWTSPGEVTFWSEGTDGGRVDGGGGGEGKEMVAVPAVRFRDLLDEPADFVKLDIEGGEHEVLPDAHDRLDRVDAMFIEYHSFHRREQPLADILALLRDAGFRVHIHGEGVAARPFVERVDIHGMDNQLDLFCYRS